MTGTNLIDNSRTAKFSEEIGLDPDLILKKILSTKIGIKISPKYLETKNGQVILEFLIDIHFRMFTEIVIDVGELNFNIHKDLDKLITNSKLFNRKINIGSIEECDVKLLIGEKVKDEKYHFYISSNGWLSYVSPIEPAAIEINYLCNPIGAAMAAALGSAEVFKYVLKDELNKIGRKIDFKTLRFSCFSFIANEEKAENPALPDLIDIGDVKMIGAGAVGMAFVAVLKYLKISGSLTVIDNDIVDNSNLDRYLGVYNESIGKYKTHIVKEVLNHIEGLNVICNSNKYQNYVETYGRNMDVAICSVDNDDARQELQCDLPRIILNGATGGSTFSVSRHDFLNYACLGCLYPTDQEKFKNEEKFAQMLGVPVGVFTHKYENNIILNEFEIEKIKQYIDIPERLLNNNKGITLRSLLGDSEVCGRFKLPNDIGISGAIAFVSAMPGLLLAGELIKERYFKLDVLKNAFHVNSLYGPSKNSGILRTKVNEKECSCYCSNPIMIELYNRKYT